MFGKEQLDVNLFGRVSPPLLFIHTGGKKTQKNETFLFPSTEDQRGMEQHSAIISYKQSKEKVEG